MSNYFFIDKWLILWYNDYSEREKYSPRKNYISKRRKNYVQS
jgi:hypothetical protein